MAKFKMKSNLEKEANERIALNIRILKGDKKELEILAEIADGVSSLQDLFDAIIKDTLKQNKAILEDFKNKKNQITPSIKSEEEELKELLEEEEEKKK